MRRVCGFSRPFGLLAMLVGVAACGSTDNPAVCDPTRTGECPAGTVCDRLTFACVSEDQPGRIDADDAVAADGGITDAIADAPFVMNEPDAATIDGPVSSDVGARAQGGACQRDDECDNGQCVDGVCCAQRACGACAACGAGSGVCAPIAAGQPDPDDCAGTGDRCDGAGTCQRGAGAACNDGNQCATGFCVDGTCCASACTGRCFSCNQTPGQCLPLLTGSDENASQPCTEERQCTENPERAGESVCRLRDGQPCVDRSSCINECVQYYRDGDNDGFGATPVRFCASAGTPPPAGHVSKPGDCRDDLPGVNPNQTAYFGTAMPGGGFDYDCSGTLALEFPDLSQWNTDPPLTAVPPCGQVETIWERECIRSDCLNGSCALPGDMCTFSCVGDCPGCSGGSCTWACTAICEYFDTPRTQGCR